MSRFTHPICDACWTRATNGRTPLRLTEPEEEQCCFCGVATVSGIYVRKDPKELPACTGHDDPDDS